MKSDHINLTKLFLISNLWMTSALIVMSPLIARAEHSYHFRCNDSINNSKKLVPTTMILFANRKSIPLIWWESNFSSNPKKRCDQVSQRFDEFSKLGKLHFLRFARDRRGGTMICGLSKSEKDRLCDESARLFDLSNAIKDPKQVLNGLKLVMEGEGGGIPQSSGDSSQLVDLDASIEEARIKQDR